MSDSRPRCFTPGERASRYPLNRGLDGRMDPRVVLEASPAGNRATFSLSGCSLVVILSMLGSKRSSAPSGYDSKCLLPPSPAYPVPDVRVKSDVSPRKVQSKMCI
jgi:hypothetical protein